jgi:TRAP-type mannitol/chloroaromatic compound transport system permease large subunit
MLTIGMQLVILLLGCFMEQVAIMLITLPIFMPIISAVGLDPVWFGVIVLINLETALMTPPFGLLIFVMKGAAPPDVTFRDIYVAAAPFIVINLLTMALLTAFPGWVTALDAIIR